MKQVKAAVKDLICCLKKGSKINIVEITMTDRKNKIQTCFIYILDSSNSSSFTFWSSQLASSSRSNWTGIWTGNSNGTWTDKQSSHFSKAKEIRVKTRFFFHVTITTNKYWNDAEILLNKSFANDDQTSASILELNRQTKGNIKRHRWNESSWGSAVLHDCCVGQSVGAAAWDHFL